jgi:hypothetical protein
MAAGARAAWLTDGEWCRYPEISGGGTASAVASPPGPAMVLTRVDGKTVSAAGTWPADVRSGCSEGFSTSRTCEMSLSKQTETHFKSLFYILDKVPRAASAPIQTRDCVSRPPTTPLRMGR